MPIRKVLIVDDSNTERTNLEQICIGAGYTVITARSGIEAVAKVNSELPDVVLLDIIMSDMNGFQVCRAITSNSATKDIPVVLVSSKNEKTDRIWGEQQGARGYIVKPYTTEQVLQQLAQI